MIDYLISQGYTVHLSPGLVALEQWGCLLDYPTLTEAYAAAQRMAAKVRKLAAERAMA